MDLSEQCGYTQADCARMSSSDEGFMIMDLKTKACDALLAHRVEAKVKGSLITSVINRERVHPRGRQGAQNVNLKEKYLCTPDSRDIMHEIVDRKNITDFRLISTDLNSV
ncbi:hypothetical protein DFH09DRAFT_1455681 [Mycena vulgaris]|nr:hypothetical protein DFH09DRAFT_1455681 [Mycena vulgaris]